MGMFKHLGLKFVGWYSRLPDIYSIYNLAKFFKIYSDIHMESLRKKYLVNVEITSGREESRHVRYRFRRCCRR